MALNCMTTSFQNTEKRFSAVVRSGFAAILLLAMLTGCSTAPRPEAPHVETSDTPVALGENVLLGIPVDETGKKDESIIIELEAFTLEYNNVTHNPDWVSWHLEKADLGTGRDADFESYTELPDGWYSIKPSDYTNSGFDRGHMCPNADRNADAGKQAETFYMINMVPQAPNNNQIVWKSLEDDLRKIVENNGYEAYIIAGPYGEGGRGSKGEADRIELKNGEGYITVPESTWKIVLLLKDGTNDLSRIDEDTRVIAINVPNVQGVQGSSKNKKRWYDYVTTVDEIERLTGLDFFTSLPDSIEDELEGRIDRSAKTKSIL